ncbi:MAG: flippase-like domain-containing protein [Verrucomicrobiales bacterium]|nr:flippase-like domain-containing protein [Verrucomicrobiales bacterium]
MTAVLMAWAFHAIFHDQCRVLLDLQGVDLDAMPRWDRWMTVWRLGPAELGRTLVGVRPGWLAASIGLWGVTIVVGALRWLWILRSQGLDPGFRRTLEISLVAHFFNSFLLGSAGGDVLKAYYAARVTRHRKTEAVTTVLLDRILGLFTMLGFAAAFIVPNLDLIRLHGQTQLLAVVVLGMFAAAGLVLWLSLRGGVSGLFPSARDWVARLPMGAALGRGIDAGRSLGRHPGLVVRTVIGSTVLTFVCVLQLLTLVWGYGLDVAWMPLFFVVPAVICISALPLTPNGLGVRDNLYMYLLSLPQIGVSAGTAVAISLVAYACSLVWSALGGVLYLFMRREADLAGAVAEGRADSEAHDS